MIIFRLSATDIPVNSLLSKLERALTDDQLNELVDLIASLTISEYTVVG
jgi:hypothetical protein